MLHFIVALGIEHSTSDIKLETINVASGFHEFGYYYYYDYDYYYYYYYYFIILFIYYFYFFINYFFFNGCELGEEASKARG